MVSLGFIFAARFSLNTLFSTSLPQSALTLVFYHYLCTRKSINLEFDMKFLSCILALWVMLLSTLPCFLEDECLFQHTDDMQEDTCPNNNGTSCTDCCSPFLHCSTCTGFLIPKEIHSPFIRMVLLNDNLHSFYKERLIPQFSSAIWQPPKLINT